MVLRIPVIQTLPDERCPHCGLMEELRPYGPNFSKICFECAEKQPKADIDARMHHKLWGDPLPKHLEHEVGN